MTHPYAHAPASSAGASTIFMALNAIGFSLNYLGSPNGIANEYLEPVPGRHPLN